MAWNTAIIHMADTYRCMNMSLTSERIYLRCAGVF